MRHRKTGRKLGRNSSHRKAMYANMVTSLFDHGLIKTTDAKAKELRRIAARLVTLGKKNTVHAKRRAARIIRDRAVLVKLFDEIAPGFSERNGGYTRIIKLGNRRGDNAPVSLIELLPAGAPESRVKRAKPRVKPSLKSSVSVPESKERFEPAHTDTEVAEAAPVEEAASAAPIEEAEAAPAEEAASEEAEAAPAEEAASEEAEAAPAEEAEAAPVEEAEAALVEEADAAPAEEEAASEEAEAAPAEEPASEEAASEEAEVVPDESEDSEESSKED
jgi:large subunit ribosomal protein L17